MKTFSTAYEAMLFLRLGITPSDPTPTPISGFCPFYIFSYGNLSATKDMHRHKQQPAAQLTFTFCWFLTN